MQCKCCTANAVQKQPVAADDYGMECNTTLALEDCSWDAERTSLDNPVDREVFPKLGLAIRISKEGKERSMGCEAVAGGLVVVIGER
jgi:hypothetical protein